MKNRIEKYFVRCAIMLVAVLVGPQVGFAQEFGEGPYKLSTEWLTDDKVLDIVPGGRKDKLHLTSATNASGQMWKITPVGGGYYRLTTQWLGKEKSLDVVNDGNNDKVRMADTSNAVGQMWKITPVGRGYYRLTTKWLGPERSLDVIKVGDTIEVRLAETAKITGQSWKLTDLSIAEEPASTTPRKFKSIPLAGFEIRIDEAVAEKPESKQLIDTLSKQIEVMITFLKPDQIKKLQTVKVWIEYKRRGDGSMWYHTDPEFVRSNGYPPEMENSIEIMNVKNFMSVKRDKTYGVFHEFAHAWQDLYIPDLQEELETAYQNAVAGGKYDKVDHINGGKERAYALTDITEYFAEISEAYFGKNDYYPFNREQLQEFDPEGFKVVQKAWK